MIKNRTEAFFNENPYNVENGDILSQLLATRVRDMLRDSNTMPRYKLAVQVYLGEKKDQKVSIIAKGYWDTYVDNYVTYTYTGDSFYCTVIAWGFYTD